MTNIQLSIIVGAVILTGCLAAFGPSAFAGFRQAQRDDSFKCQSYRVEASLNRLKVLSGDLASRLEEERLRQSGGCSPY